MFCSTGSVWWWCPGDNISTRTARNRRVPRRTIIAKTLSVKRRTTSPSSADTGRHRILAIAARHLRKTYSVVGIIIIFGRVWSAEQYMTTKNTDSPSIHPMDKTQQRFSIVVTIAFSLVQPSCQLEETLICCSDLLSPSFWSSGQKTNALTTHNNCWSGLTIDIDTIWHISSIRLDFTISVIICRFWSADQWTCTYNQTTTAV